MRKFVYMIIMITLLFLITGCQDWLDVKPKTETEAEELFQTEEGFKGALAGVYTAMNQPTLYGREMTFGFVDAIAQQWKVGDNHSYSDAIKGIYEATTTMPIIDSLWIGLYNVVSNANSILTNIDARRDVFTGDNYSIIKGEALAIRAYLHFDLLRLFGVNGVSESDADGIPYQDSLTKHIPITQSPKKIAELIIKDLETAKSYLELDPIKTGRMIEVSDDNGYLINRHYHLNYYAVVGVLARVYHYIGDAEKAMQYAKEVLDAQSDKRFAWGKTDEVGHAIKELRDRTISSEHLFALNTRKLINYIDGYFIDTEHPLVLREGKANVYPVVTDIRAKFYETGNNVPDVPSKLWQMEGMVESGKRVYPKRDRMPMIRISEMYYICAECKAATPVEAINYLNTILEHRGYSENDLLSSETVNSAQLIQTEILKEVKREFVCEGQLFYFYKRTGIMPDNQKLRYVLPKPEVELEFGN